MLIFVTLSFCVMRMLLKVIWSPGLDMQSSQGIHCRNSMLTCNTTISTSATSVECTGPRLISSDSEISA